MPTSKGLLNLAEGTKRNKAQNFFFIVSKLVMKFYPILKELDIVSFCARGYFVRSHKTYHATFKLGS